MSAEGLAARIPTSPDVIVRERIMHVETCEGYRVTLTFRGPAHGVEPLRACENFAVRYACALMECAHDPFARARALRGQVREVD